MAKTQLFKRRLSPKALLGLLVALIAAFLLLLSLVNVAQKYFAIRRHIRALQAEQIQLSEKLEYLTERNSYLNTPEGSERILREKYNVLRPGEGVVVIVDKNSVAEDTTSSKPSTWWQKLFFGLGLHKK